MWPSHAKSQRAFIFFAQAFSFWSLFPRQSGTMPIIDPFPGIASHVKCAAPTVTCCQTPRRQRSSRPAQTRHRSRPRSPSAYLKPELSGYFAFSFSRFIRTCYIFRTAIRNINSSVSHSLASLGFCLGLIPNRKRITGIRRTSTSYRRVVTTNVPRAMIIYLIRMLAPAPSAVEVFHWTT